MKKYFFLILFLLSIIMCANAQVLELKDDESKDENEVVIKEGEIIQNAHYSTKSFETFHKNGAIEENLESIYEDEVGIEEREGDSLDINESDSPISNRSSSLSTEYMDESVWELFKKQIKSDLAPFLMLVPPPAKKYIAKQWATFLVVADGAFGPLKKPLKRGIQMIGKSVIMFGETLIEISRSIRIEEESEVTNNDSYSISQSGVSDPL